MPRRTAAPPSMPAPKAVEEKPKKNAAFANVCFGETSVLFGAILLASALSVARRWPLHGVALLGLVGGLVDIVIGARIYNAWLTAMPEVTCAGFILTGLLGILALPTVANPTKVLRACTAILTLLAAVLWGGLGLYAYWGHVARRGADQIRVAWRRCLPPCAWSRRVRPPRRATLNSPIFPPILIMLLP